MFNRTALLQAAGAPLLAVALAIAVASPVAALSTKECSAKYKAAKDAGTLAGKSWNDFRKAECGADDKPAEKAATAPATKEKAVTPSVAAGNAVYPGAIAVKYAKESPAKQRFHTCLDQYNANKASGGNGGMKWIQKGGGYYSKCNARLKS